MIKYVFILIFSIIVNLSFGQVQKKTLKTSDKSKQKYSCYLPEGYKKKDSIPLIIALHWGWKQEKLPDYYSSPFLRDFILPIFKSQDAIIVAPDCSGNSWIEKKSVLNIIELRDYCINKYNIDSNKVLVTGFSAGAIATWYLAAYYSDFFNCAMPIAGYPKKEWIENINEIPLIIVNSIDDKVIPFERVINTVDYLEKNGKNYYFKKLKGIGHYDNSLYIIQTKYCLPYIRFE